MPLPKKLKSRPYAAGLDLRRELLRKNGVPVDSLDHGLSPPRCRRRRSSRCLCLHLRGMAHPYGAVYPFPGRSAAQRQGLEDGNQCLIASIAPLSKRRRRRSRPTCGATPVIDIVLAGIANAGHPQARTLPAYGLLQGARRLLNRDRQTPFRKPGSPRPRAAIMARRRPMPHSRRRAGPYFRARHRRPGQSRAHQELWRGYRPGWRDLL